MSAAGAKTLPLLELLAVMAECREGDRREGLLLRQNRGWFHVAATGHEALAAAAYCLEPDDMLWLYYRDKPIAMARGASSYDAALGYYAKEASSSGGRMMPSHFSSPSLGIVSVATTTGTQCVPAAGTAWAFKLAGKSNVALCTIGDASTRQGEFFEALAFALQEKLPVVFLVEDNHYGISTPTAHMTPFAIGALSSDCLVHVNGRDAIEVYEKCLCAVDKARAGHGPTVLWCDLDRLASHTSSDDQRVYRALDELVAATHRDPLDLLANRLIAEGQFAPEAWAVLQKDIRARVDDAYQQADTQADPVDVETYLYGTCEAPPFPFDPPAEPTTMVALINQTLRAALQSNERMVMFGEDIADPKGGVFGFTKGLSSAFPDRVFNSPLAEATIVGAAVGLATAGMRPVFEIQFVDFITPALNQLINQVANMRWRSKGEWACPMVLMAPYGAYLPAGGIWHSQCNEGVFAHFPGIRVAIPHTPEDAAGLLWSAIHGDDPTLFLIPKHLFRQRHAISSLEAVPFGRAVVRRDGEDVTLVSWGNCLELCFEAARNLSENGIEAEIIDLRTIVPCDWSAIEASLTKTGRLVVVHEDNRTCGFGQAIIAEATTRASMWNQLLAQPQLVARTDTPVPYNPALEYAALPDVTQIVDAVQQTLE
ncbi:MAG: tungsten formylmethanofuran dehydrogenase subunit E [Candidatus Hydrogenedentota bacterium]